MLTFDSPRGLLIGRPKGLLGVTLLKEPPCIFFDNPFFGGFKSRHLVSPPDSPPPFDFDLPPFDFDLPHSWYCVGIMSMSKFSNPDVISTNPNVIPPWLVAKIVKHFGKVKIVYLTKKGPTDDPADPGILGTFYAASNLPDGDVNLLDAAIRAIDETKVLTIQRMSMGNNIKRGYGLFGDKVAYKFNNTVHKGLVTAETQEMIRVMSDWLATEFNSVLANAYTGEAAISPHSDNEGCLASLLHIPGLSVAPRNPLPGDDYQFVIRTASQPGVRAKIVYKYTFPPISLFGMYGPDFQKSFTHAIPAGPKGRGRRVSLTFRVLTGMPATTSKPQPQEGRKRKAEGHDAADATAVGDADKHVAKK